jgi:hypothetical protein
MENKNNMLNINARKPIHVLMNETGDFLCQFTGIEGPRWSKQMGQALQAEKIAEVEEKARRIAETHARRLYDSGVFYGADLYHDFRDVRIYQADVWGHEDELARILPTGLHCLREDFVSACALLGNGKQGYVGFSTAPKPRLARTISKAVGFPSAEEARHGAQKRTIALTYVGNFTCE